MEHRDFLHMDHKYRSNGRSFNGKKEHRPPPELLNGEHILDKLQNINNAFGKLQKNCSDSPWKKKSIFFELPN